LCSATTSITTGTTASDDFIDHGVQTLEDCQGLCHAGTAPNGDGRLCVGITMASETLNRPLGAACSTFYADCSDSKCLVRALTGNKPFCATRRRRCTWTTL
jgi:hypothetical protein